MYGRFGKIRAHDGQRPALIGHLLRAAELLRATDGCLMYVVGSADDDPHGVWVMEAWRTRDDHRASLTLDAVKELIAVARPIIAGMEPAIEFTPLGGKGLPADAASRP